MTDDSKIGADELLACGKTVSTMTLGASMRPMLRQHRDVVTVIPIDRPLQKGDVILYRRPEKERLVLHRIVAIRNGQYILRGDNNYFTEYDVRPADIVGILKEFYRGGKYINCETNRKYRLYTFYICHSYPLRFVYKKTRKKLRSILSRIKHRFFN